MIRTQWTSSLRARLTLWYLGVLVVSLGLFTTLLCITVSRSLRSHHDHELEQEAARLSRLLVPTGLAPDRVEALVPLVRAAFLIVRDGDGRLVFASPSVATREPEATRDTRLIEATQHGPHFPSFLTVDLPNAGETRFVCVPVGEPPVGFVQIGEPLGNVADTLSTVTTISIALIPIVLVLTSAGAWHVAGRALAPMADIDRTLQAIQASDLSRRIDVEAADRELGSLVKTLNRLLSRLERAFAATKQFAEDASHQLQTPLAVMKGALDVALGTRRTPEVYEQTLRTIGDEIEGMTTVLGDLRALSLADAGSDAGSSGQVDFSATCRDVLEDLQALGEARGLSVAAEIADGIIVPGSTIRLRQVLLNLGDNAINYTPPGGTVRIVLTADGADAILEVTDTGTGIAPEHLPHVFDRFYRADVGQRRQAGTGLGLAIAKKIVEAHGGTITIDSREHVGTRVSVRVPRGES